MNRKIFIEKELTEIKKHPSKIVRQELFNRFKKELKRRYKVDYIKEYDTIKATWDYIRIDLKDYYDKISIELFNKYYSDHYLDIFKKRVDMILLGVNRKNAANDISLLFKEESMYLNRYINNSREVSDFLNYNYNLYINSFEFKGKSYIFAM